MAKHTEGPWKVVNCEVFDSKDYGICVPYCITKEDEANMRLIAAAPAMELALANVLMAAQMMEKSALYKALKNAEAVLHQCGFFDESKKELADFMEKG